MNAVPMMLMYAGKMIAVLLLVFLLALLTPKLAKLLGKSKKNRSHVSNTGDVRSEGQQTERPLDYTVTGLYDAQPSDDDCNCDLDCDCDVGCDCDADCDCDCGSDSTD